MNIHSLGFRLVFLLAVLALALATLEGLLPAIPGNGNGPLGDLALGGRTALAASGDVSITTSGLQPALITVNAGDSVTWINNTGVRQIVKSGTPYSVFIPLAVKAGAPGYNALPAQSLTTQWRAAVAGTFSLTVEPGNTGTLVFDVPGEFPYFLATMPNITGQVTVLQSGPPPDPSLLAPPVDPTVPTDFFSANEFLWTGATPIQTGVAPGTLEAKRLAILRGKVSDRGGAPLPGVKISVLDHPEFGQTLSRADGMFDLAVNGGGTLTLEYAKGGYLSAQRSLQVPWREFVYAPDVALAGRDTKATAVNLASPAPVQVHQASAVTDGDGDRQATLLFKNGTTANAVLPNGTSLPLADLTVRASEYTVGADGPNAMPAQLPAASGYTYAVEFSVDEAEAAGARDVEFSQPVVTYVDNFLGFAVGTVVPVGYYDRLEARWVPATNGAVIAVTGVSGGLADVDAGGATLNPALTDAERAQLATLYGGKTLPYSLWRVGVSHFSPWDYNWPYGPPPDATPPNQPQPQPRTDRQKGDCDEEGSIIECESQVLAEFVAITGTPFRAHYTSGRVPGRTGSRVVDIPLSGSSVPASLKRIDLTLEIAGKRSTESHAPVTNLVSTFTWDGRDAYGRAVYGQQLLASTIDYVYEAEYMSAAEQGAAFAAFGGALTGVKARQEVVISQKAEVMLDGITPPGLILGGWTLDAHHAYDAATGMLHRGDGSLQSGGALATDGLKKIAGNGYDCYWDSPLGCGNGGPATAAQVSPYGMVVAPDGALYFVNYGQNRSQVRRIGTDGIITTVAGTTTDCPSPTDPCGDGGPATQAQLNTPTALALGPDGSLYVLDNDDHRVRKIDPEGIISTVAGTGAMCGNGYDNPVCGDGGPAVSAQLNSGWALAVDGSGSIYIGQGPRIRRIGPDGTITTVAGSVDGSGRPYSCLPNYGQPGPTCGDEGPAEEATLSSPEGLAFGPDGSLYIADSGTVNRIRRIGPDGIIHNFAGDGASCYPGTANCGDGGPATSAQVYLPKNLAVAPDGTVYLTSDNRIRSVSPRGIITTVAGTVAACGAANLNPYRPCAQNGMPATSAQIAEARALALAADGSFYFSDVNMIWKVEIAAPAYSVGDKLVPARDGSEVYHFDADGRHLRTLDSLTGAVRYTFAYDTANRLAAITDNSANVTALERDAAGNLTAIVAPGGQRTTFTHDANGYLATIANPAGETRHYAYTPGGLMTSFADPLNNYHYFIYDGDGLLTRDEAPDGGYKVLGRTKLSDGYRVTVTTATGRSRSYQVQRLDNGNEQTIRVNESGAVTSVLAGRNGVQTVTYPDGGVVTLAQGPDPRWGMLAPLPKSVVYTTPGGLTSETTRAQSVSLANASDPLSLVSYFDVTSINGNNYIESYTSSNRTRTATTPLGRQRTTVFDTKGRVIYDRAGTGTYSRTFAYDAKGRLQSITQENQSVTYTYDDKNRISSATDALGHITTYGFDLADRVISVTLPGNHTYGLAYDANGNLTQVTMPSGDVHAIAYNEVAQRTGYTPPENGAYGWSYDLDRALDLYTLPGSRAIDYTYDATTWRATGETYGPGDTATFAYAAGDKTERPSSLVRTPASGPAQTIDFTYDAGLVKSATYSGVADGAFTYTYDNNLMPTSVVLNSGADSVTTPVIRNSEGLPTTYGPFTVQRNGPLGMPNRISDANLIITYGYDGHGRVNARTNWLGGGNTRVYQLALTHDNAGRLVSRAETINSEAAINTTYLYDDLGQLTEVKVGGITTESYAYDANGNRTGRTLGANPAETSTYDDQDRLVSRGGVVYTFDAAGFLASRGGDTFVYSSAGELTQATVGGQTVTYAYDALHRRVGRTDTSGTTQYLYGNLGNPVQVTAVRGADGALSYLYYDDAGLLFAFTRGGTTYYVATDQVGSPRLVRNAGGSVVKIVTYDAYGNITGDSDPTLDLPIGYAGGLWDPATGLVRFGFRDYEPASGRWTARDPLFFAGGQGNLYGYVGNNPISSTDPLGLWSAGGSAYAGPGAGFKLTYADGKVQVCIEVGFGAGGDLTLSPFDEPGRDSETIKVEAEGECAGAGAGGSVELDDCGRIKVKPKVKLGPFSSEDGGTVQKGTVPDRQLSPKCKGQVKLAGQVCRSW